MLVKNTCESLRLERELQGMGSYSSTLPSLRPQLNWSFVRVTPPQHAFPPHPHQGNHQGEAVASPGVLSSNKLFCESFLLSPSCRLYACHVNGKHGCVNSRHHSGRQHRCIKWSQLQKAQASECSFFLEFGAKLL